MVCLRSDPCTNAPGDGGRSSPLTPVGIGAPADHRTPEFAPAARSASFRPVAHVAAGAGSGRSFRLHIRSSCATFCKAMSQSAQEFADGLLARGRHTFTGEEADSALGVSPNAAYLALRRMVKQGRLAMPRRGFYLILEPQHRALGALPPANWIADLMRFHGAPYYVGLLSAAALHGAAHQQPQEFQVVTSAILRPVTVGRVRIRFFVRGQMRRAATQQMKTPSGPIAVSTPEMTAYDLVRYRNAASIDHVATVIAELAERMDPARLVAVARKNHEPPVIQRLGYLLERTGHAALADALARLPRKGRVRSVPLEPGSPERVAERSARWHVLVNADVEVEA